MIFEILTLFPDMFAGPFSDSIIKRAQEKAVADGAAAAKALVKVHELEAAAAKKSAK